MLEVNALLHLHLFLDQPISTQPMFIIKLNILLYPITCNIHYSNI